MIVYDYFDKERGLIVAKSDNNKCLREYDKNGNLTIDKDYPEAVNYGKIINGVGMFDNGNFYMESDKDIPIIEEKVSQETNSN